MEIKIARADDWELLSEFYRQAYRPGHPLHQFCFWKWQFENNDHGLALIALKDNRVIGHLGLGFSDGYAWHINLYVLEGYRNTSVAVSLITKAGAYGRGANLSANANAVKLYRLLKWYQYANLIRLTKTKDTAGKLSIDSLLSGIRLTHQGTSPPDYYFQQPGIRSVLLHDGSKAVLQPEVGGARFVSLVNVKEACRELWDLGFTWCDFVSSFNNPLLLKLEQNGWQSDADSKIPWLLNPVVKNTPSLLTFLSKEPIDINFHINRTHSDIGRVGSLH